jgi:hypothetical protein
MQELDFGQALHYLRQGFKLQRAGWNGTDMFIFLVSGSRFQVSRAPLNTIYSEGTWIDYHPHIDLRTATGEIVPWVAPQSDLLANDWQLVI